MKFFVPGVSLHIHPSTLINITLHSMDDDRPDCWKQIWRCVRAAVPGFQQLNSQHGG